MMFTALLYRYDRIEMSRDQCSFAYRI